MKVIKYILMLTPFGLCLLIQNLVLLILYAVMSLLCFLLYGLDKKNSMAKKWRIPEKHLHQVELFGGWPGALLGQLLFRHKTQKISFRIVLWVVIIVHLSAWALYFYHA